MKNNIWSVVIFIGIILIILYGFNQLRYITPKGYVLISQETIDSIKNLANKPPQIVIKDSIVYRDTIIYITKTNVAPTTVVGAIKEYRDSIYTDSLRVWTSLKYTGDILRFDQWYKPVAFYRTITKTIIMPYPVVQLTDNSFNRFYLSGNVGGNYNRFFAGIGIDYINTSGYILGGQYERFNNENIIMVKFGKLITIKHKKK